MNQYIPLYHFFTTLRGHKDFSLGLEEYFSLIEVFQKDPSYQANEKKLLNLCRLLWLQPGQSENLFVSLFQQSFAADKSLGNKEEQEKNITEEKSEQKQETAEDNNDKKKDANEEESETADTTSEQETAEDLYLNIIKKNVGQSVKTTSEAELVAPYPIHLLDKHIVVKERQLKQRWRSLKKIVDGSISDQIDIAKTIDQVAKTGFIATPSFQRATSNRAALITLIDNQGSMVAFKGLTNALLDTAEKGANINNSVFYFKNLPKLNEENTDFYIYKTPAHTTYSGLLKELQQHFYKQKDVAILIISDGGAARGNLNLDRLNATVQLLQVLKYFSFKIAWLNPVPKDRWPTTTASLITDFVPMLEANENGLKEAVEILRGKIPANTRLFYEEMILE